MADASQLRRTMRRWATGVTVVTARHSQGWPLGFTASAVCSVSLDPPLILVCIARRGASREPILQTGIFAVHILGSGQEALARRFAVVPVERRFEGVDSRPGPLGVPLIEGALAWLVCRVWESYAGGDHSIVVGEVMECEARDGDPLLYFGGGYRRLAR